MCKCTPEIRTPYCGRPGCEWPPQEPPAEGSPRALDALVAEHVMGFRREKAPRDYDGQHAGNDILVPPDVGGDFCYPPRGPISVVYHVPRYSASLEAAWRVVGRLRDHYGFHVGIHTSESGAHVAVTRPTDEEEPTVEFGAPGEEPQLICRAAIAAVPSGGEAD
jgi:Phage ABA sandwich domain